MHTKLFTMTEQDRQDDARMLIDIWPTLKWRHAGFGALQAYLRENEKTEIRVHLWHDSLIKEGITHNGLCHNHRFDMKSFVINGKIIQTEFKLIPSQNGDWETLSILHAREAIAKGGGENHHPIPTGNYFYRSPIVFTIKHGEGYTFDKYAFHETRFIGTTITIIEKTNQEDTMAQILGRRGVPVVHAFTDQINDFKNILDEGLEILQFNVNNYSITKEHLGGWS